MPRAFDSDGTHGGVTFVENVECGACGSVAECYFTADAETIYDLGETPTGVHVCPTCGASTQCSFSGWTLYTEAG